MRRTLLAGVCLLMTGSGVFAQNKTLGVGVASPNPNAALHVESPTGNQGFIMPRLTTVQREAMTALLTDADKGLMLYDTDLYTIFIWDGKAWGNTSQFTIDDPASSSDAISVLNQGLGVAGRFKTDNIATAMPTIWAETNSNAPLSAPIYGLNTGTGDVAASFRITNDASPFPAIFAESNGTGRTATFRKLGTSDSQPAVYVDSKGGHGIWADHNGATGYAAIIQNINASNSTAAMFVEAVGSGQSIWAQKSDPASTGDAIFGEHLGANGSAGKFQINNVNSVSPALWAETNSDQPLSAPIYGRNTGTGDVAASFRIENASNGQAAAYAETNGSGAAVFGNQIGTGRGGQFQIQNGANAQAAVRSFTNGTGRSGYFTINNTANTSAGIFSETNGSGPAIEAENSGTADGFAGLFNNMSGTNNFPAIQASSNGNGPAIRAMQTNGTGAGMDVFMQNTTATAPGFAVDQRGLGNAGSFVVNNTSNTGPAVFASTTASGGNAMALSNDGFGIALALTKGGLQVTTSEISNGTSLATRASAYRITSTSGTTFTVDFGPVDGEVFMVFNDTLQPVTVGGVTIPNGEGKTIVVFPGGVLRGM